MLIDSLMIKKKPNYKDFCISISTVSIIVDISLLLNLRQTTSIM